jgi:hypothetical protein
MPLLAFSALVAQQPHGSHPEQRQFDFWIGTWEVEDRAGQRLGRNRIEPLLGGAVLQETWEGAKGGQGTSLNAWLPSRKVWRQTWVDNQGQVLDLEGGLNEGRMVLEGETQGRHQRITWTPLPDGRVLQVWEQSQDGGRTWTRAFEGYYRKVKNAREKTN